MTPTLRLTGNVMTLCDTRKSDCFSYGWSLWV